MDDRLLRENLARLSRRYDRRFLGTDPVGIVRRFENPADREVMAFLAAGLAYGRVGSIRASLDDLLARFGTSPAAFARGFDPRRDARRLDGFAHRFTRGRDVGLFLFLLRQARERAGTLERFFLEGDLPGTPDLEVAMDAFGARLFALAPGPLRGGLPGARWLLPLPCHGSVAKRHCLLLRWLVRPDDGVDLGLWSSVSPARLIVPLDVHLQRVARALGWTRRRTPGWPMALEVTARLRRLTPGDPVRHDFALCRLGILGLLRARGRTLRRSHVLQALADALGEEAA
ncbi:MAG TPA: TIGR02757 family protein [Candidatus Polarisedimenticolaceae bacterium]|nr:TIGR02757 family protein [Candidatus Polarisedimenticolaceae bacterium]